MNIIKAPKYILRKIGLIKDFEGTLRHLNIQPIYEEEKVPFLMKTKINDLLVYSQEKEMCHQYEINTNRNGYVAWKELARSVRGRSSIIPSKGDILIWKTGSVELVFIFKRAFHLSENQDGAFYGDVLFVGIVKGDDL